MSCGQNKQYYRNIKWTWHICSVYNDIVTCKSKDFLFFIPPETTTFSHRPTRTAVMASHIPRADSAFSSWAVYSISWPRWLHTSWSQSMAPSAPHKHSLAVSRRSQDFAWTGKKTDIGPPWKIGITFDAVTHYSSSEKDVRCLQSGLRSRSFSFIAEFREYSDDVSWWHFVMCSAEGEKATEGNIIYWLNFTVINVFYKWHKENDLFSVEAAEIRKLVPPTTNSHCTCIKYGLVQSAIT